MPLDEAPAVPSFSQPIQVFGASVAGIKESITWGVGAILVGVFFLVAGYFVSLNPNRPHGLTFGVIAFVIALLFSLVFWLNIFWLKGRRIWIYPEGVVDCFRSKCKTFRWEDVEEIVYWPSIHDLAMRNAEGVQFDFGYLTIGNAGELATHIVENVKGVLATRLAKQIKSGGIVGFGRILADQDGITIHYRALASNKPNSFYKGPWPEGDFNKMCAKGQKSEFVKIAWEDVVHFEEDDETGHTTLITKQGAVPLCSTPSDLPNLVALPLVGRLLI